MAHIGEVLRRLREEWGLTFRDVEKRSKLLAEAWGNSDYAISHGYLHQVEETGNNVSARKLVSLAEIYSVSPESLFQHCIPKKRVSMVPDPLGGPPNTRVLTEGRLAERANVLLPDDFGKDPIPEQTTLLESRAENDRGRYQRVIIGTKDRTLYPLINPGAILKIDTFRRSIATRKEWKDEFDRPCYLLYTRKGYLLAWCQLEERGRYLQIVPHVRGSVPDDLGPARYPRFLMNEEIQVVGRAIAKIMNLEDASAEHL